MPTGPDRSLVSSDMSVWSSANAASKLRPTGERDSQNCEGQTHHGQTNYQSGEIQRNHLGGL